MASCKGAIPIISAVVLFLLPAYGQSIEQNWDPLAVNDFPDHDAAVADPKLAAQMVHGGENLFRARFNILDGVGRPAATGDSKPTLRPPGSAPLFHRISGPDANSCAGCHNQPVVGGSGDFATNVFVGAHKVIPFTNRIDPDITSERHTPSLFGSGVIEMLAREITQELLDLRMQALTHVQTGHEEQTVPLISKGIDFGTLVVRPNNTVDTRGLKGIDDDLIIRPFGVKGVAASLREFTLFALNQHHGIQGIERFGWERTGVHDFAGHGKDFEFSVGQVSAIVLFQALLRAPDRLPSPDPSTSEAEQRGEKIFKRIGCTACHVPELVLHTGFFSEPSPYNRPGAIIPADVSGVVEIRLPVTDTSSGIRTSNSGDLIVSAYTDLKRHVICDEEVSFLCNEKIRQDNVSTDEFLTAKLWSVATSAPYCHRGDCSTLSEAILYHGGEAREARLSFLSLTDGDKKAVIRFLLSLGRAPR